MVDKRSSEQQFHKQMVINFVVWKKTGAVTLVQPGLMAGWQAGKMVLNLEILKLYT